MILNRKRLTITVELKALQSIATHQCQGTISRDLMLFRISREMLKVIEYSKAGKYHEASYNRFSLAKEGTTRVQFFQVLSRDADDLSFVILNIRSPLPLTANVNHMFCFPHAV